ncbi:MAG: hypothetical protein AUG44_07040 [Actinobacteria bacterium 13_1_20CM_3_71_11]|nr:MAG: hypothetical protein AUG44_07040 [Actinobacteria bacterium 13_1_20CM_3_71_11]
MSTPGSAEAPAWPAPVVQNPWWTGLILGIVTVLFGVVVLAWPEVTLRVLAVLVGLWLLLGGIARIIGAFLPRGSLGRQVLSGIVGVLLVAAGMACLRNLVNALALLAFLVALGWMFSGLAETVMGLQAEGATRALLLVVGVLSILAGFVFLVMPGLSLATLVLLTGISAVVLGIGELVLAFRLRRA